MSAPWKVSSHDECLHASLIECLNPIISRKNLSHRHSDTKPSNLQNKFLIWVNFLGRHLEEEKKKARKCLEYLFLEDVVPLKGRQCISCLNERRRRWQHENEKYANGKSMEVVNEKRRKNFPATSPCNWAAFVIVMCRCHDGSHQTGNKKKTMP